MSTFGNNLIERSGPGWLMFNLKTKWRWLDCACEEFDIKGNAKTGRTDEQIVRYVFFAGCSLKSLTTEILSMASEP
jgi:hypothetical protein